MADFDTQSGKKVNIVIAPFKDAIALKNAIVKELAKSGIDLQVLVTNQTDPNVKVDTKSIISAVLNVDSSIEVTKAVFTCLQRCSYDGEKITDKTFEPEEARGDYYQVVLECVQANIYPFFMGLASRLNGIKDLLNTKAPKPQ